MMMLTVTAASAYMLPTVPAHRRCPDRASLSTAPTHHSRPARTPYIQAFAEDGPAMAPSTAALSRVQPLTTILELEGAVSRAQKAGRLLVVKVYAPWCAACKVLEPKYRRAAASHPEIDFYEVNFVQAKQLCKRSGVESLPTGMIFKNGKKVEHSCLKPSAFKEFMSRLAEHAEPEALEAAAPDTSLAARLDLENWVAAYEF
eukprot:scaffold33859_cov64-Phaeocystis_antarctica.AAC.3